MRNSISNFDVKKSFSKYVMIYLIPPIFIDEYWDYYIKEYDLEDAWNKFLEQYRFYKFTPESFETEYISVLSRSIDTIRSMWSEEHTKRQQELVESMEQKIPMISIIGYSPNIYLPDGKYLDVDIHGAGDKSLTYIGILGDKYKSIYDIFKTMSDKSIFHDMKRLRLNVHNNMQEKQEYIYAVHSKVLLEKLYQSNDPIINHLNENYKLFGKTGGDSFFYKLDNEQGLENILGDHTYDDLFYHIDIVTVKSMNIFGNQCKFILTKDKDNRLTNYALYNSCMRTNLSLYPFAMKLATGEELTEKDLAVGYEDQIFFHYDKSEIQ